jgi:hypothetical protein
VEAAAALEKDLGEEGEVPELELEPEGEAKRVQSEAVEELLTEKLTRGLVAELPAESLTLAERVWEPLERELVLREKDQLEVPEALAKEPPSTESWTEVMARPSEATPETVVVPERVAPLAGLLIDTVGGAAVTTLILRLAEAEPLTASLTATVKGNAPATVGVPERMPDEDRLRPVGSVPLETDHE